MSKRTVRFVVSLKINEGKLDAFEALTKAMISASRKEPGTLGYDWYLSADRTRCRLVETYRDESAVLAHMTGAAVRDFVPKLIEVSSVNGFEVYGDPGAKATEILAGFGAEIFKVWHLLATD
jgi:quinol monooxygenase YgiN